LLHELGALANGRLTAFGRRMAALGAHPRLAAMMLAAEEQTALACDIAALLEERDLFRDGSADIQIRLDALWHGDARADRGTLARVRQTARQYRQRLRVPARATETGDPGTLIAAAYPDRIAQARGEPGSFRLAGGGSARLEATDPFARAKLLAVAALDLKAAPRIRLAAPLSPETLPPRVAAQITESVETGLDSASGTAYARRRQRLGQLILSDQIAAVDPASLAETLAAAAGRDQLRALDWSEAAIQLQARVLHMRAVDPDWPDFSTAALAATAVGWLAPYLSGISKLADLRRLDLVRMLRDHLGHARAVALDRELPMELALPRGQMRIDYTEPVPLAASRAQNFYGLRETPRLAGGRIPLRIALLSPARRPIAVTSDLARFWTGGWADARRDMRGRYPKHDWPEDPSI
jgi:ATP-dependent helicase HrpB